MINALFVALGAALLALDQWVKAWTVAAFSAPPEGWVITADAPLPLLPGIVELTRVHNFGAAWSSFAGQRWLLLGVTGVIVVAVLFVWCRGIVSHPVGRLACALLIFGGIGNIIDRARFGYVVDMFHFQFWDSYPVFNVADMCIVAGAILGAVYYMFLYETHDRKDKTHGETNAPSE